MITVSEDVALAALNVINGRIQNGTTNPNARISLYQGTRPALPGDLNSAMKLADISLPAILFAPAYMDSGNARADAIVDNIAEANIVVTGEAQWFRIFDRNNQPVLDGSVSDASGNGDMKLQQTSLLAGRKVTIVSWITRYPQ